MWCASISASRSSTIPEMPLIEWKLRNSSSIAAGAARGWSATALEIEQQPADRRQVLVALGEVVVHEAGEERGSPLMRAPLAEPEQRRARAPASACGANGFVRYSEAPACERRAPARLVAARRQHDDRQLRERG